MTPLIKPPDLPKRIRCAHEKSRMWKPVEAGGCLPGMWEEGPLHRMGEI